MTLDGKAWVNGRVVDFKGAAVEMRDRAFMLGDGVFETMRADDGEVFRLHGHRDRLAHGLRVLGWPERLLDRFDTAVGDLVAAGQEKGWDPLRIRVQVSGGTFRDVAGMEATPELTATCTPLHGSPAAWYEEGIRVTIAAQRKFSSDPLSTVKTVSFLPHIHAKRQAIRAGYEDAILLNEHGRPVEATSANLFAFRGGTLWTPGNEEGALAGITRTWVLDQAQRRRWTVRERLTLEELVAADEVWIGNTTGGMLPVTAIEGRPIGKGQPGPVTRELSQLYRSLLRGELAPA